MFVFVSYKLVIEREYLLNIYYKKKKLFDTSAFLLYRYVIKAKVAHSHSDRGDWGLYMHRICNMKKKHVTRVAKFRNLKSDWTKMSACKHTYCNSLSQSIQGSILRPCEWAAGTAMYRKCKRDSISCGQ